MNSNEYESHPARFDDLPEASQETALRWIRANLRRRKTPLPEWSSYGLKHLLERDVCLYLTNGQFKGAMLHSRFTPTRPHDLNWCFGISKRSPAFRPNDKPGV